MPAFEPDRAFRWSLLPAIAAAALPSLLAFNLPPSATFLNQALAFATWGVWAAVLAARVTPAIGSDGRRRELVPLLAVLAVLAAAAAVSSVWGALPRPLAWSALATLFAAAVLMAAGAWVGWADACVARRLFAAFCLAWLLSGLMNAAVAVIQVLAPSLADGIWIARSAMPGRAVGNLRQPNHVCTLLLWAVIAAVVLVEMRLLTSRLAATAGAALCWALVLTGSRTAVVALVLLALWGLADRRLSRPSRALLWASPVAYAVAWGAMALWSHVSQTAFGAAQRLAETDFSAFRLGIWSDTWQLIRQHPLAGVGFGEFNFAWTLSEFPQRPQAFFDHAHNLLLHWAVELGVPLAVLLTSLLLFTLGRLVRAGWSRQAPPAATLMPRATLAFLVLMGLHSQLEYPLWYAYFLLPTAWLMGFGAAQATCCGDTAALERAPGDRRESQPAALGPAIAEPGRLRAARGALLAAALALVLGASASVQDYQRVAEIFDPNSPVPLERRLAEGQRSLFFGHHADYAIATTVAIPTAPPAGPPAAAAGQMLPSTPSQQVLESAGRAAHYLLDTRLMIAWADAWAAAGDQERARHIAARMRELGNPAWADYFSACDRAAPAAADRPYPCEASGAAALDWRDFR